ncbi:dTDP-4-dehydrorhamnose 3,5-epimerase [bioreactor metagenome]|uniref:dTDP-4-dehydrorhamnose 3,5-epimerase n=1 Tax=bioreactor metagenome TaxID=1076179 RepID=A0A645D6H4_9ZZZZ
MNVIETKLKGVYILEPRVFGDSRGWFMESWSKRTMEEAGLFYDFVQDNQSFSAQRGTLRGIHFQNGIDAQAKLVRCNKGAVVDYVLDLRKGSPTYLEWVSAELSAENKRQLLIPRGFGHAFLTLTDDVEFLYKTDNFYSPKSDRSIRWNDPEICVDWAVAEPVLSDKDKNAPLLCDSDVNFFYEV